MASRCLHQLQPALRSATVGPATAPAAPRTLLGSVRTSSSRESPRDLAGAGEAVGSVCSADGDLSCLGMEHQVPVCRTPVPVLEMTPASRHMLKTLSGEI
ncbi:hypothetical protein lerEdw1_009678 [Lerista edwardsae]|nr:hypothetical protein lerEdw1_009678 [Lerista edwardsae]